MGVCFCGVIAGSSATLGFNLPEGLECAFKRHDFGTLVHMFKIKTERSYLKLLIDTTSLGYGVPTYTS